MISARVRLLVVFSLFGLLCYACNNIPDCRNEIAPNAVKLKFYDSTDSTSLEVNFDSIKAVNTDSVFYQDTLLSYYELILDPTSTTSTFLFYKSDQVDKLELNYSKNIAIISEECGPSVTFSEIALSDYSFDSVALINDFLDQSLSENIEVYY
ncbi:DUF6452 family protein [Reichenbachiella sp. MALMAid0571]|uniref:DUF6452 family protein n=1 Tax=Reichenbachiella sp. MALMAid0571 TaxID=3143939 RepID=UPI0032DEC00C